MNRKNKRQIIRGIHCRTIQKCNEKKREKKRENEYVSWPTPPRRRKKRKRAILFPFHFW